MVPIPPTEGLADGTGVWLVITGAAEFEEGLWDTTAVESDGFAEFEFDGTELEDSWTIPDETELVGEDEGDRTALESNDERRLKER